jgi:hypothetical protein
MATNSGTLTLKWHFYDKWTLVGYHIGTNLIIITRHAKIRALTKKHLKGPAGTDGNY